jgi:transcriptional regulator with XRE-family HTH domain
MPSFINSTMKKIWKKMARKAYRDSYVGAHISNTVASQITKLRTARGWTQTQLAEHAGMKQSRISALEDPNWENVEIVTLQRIASACDVALMARFAPFSELAEWAATLSDDKLLVPTYDEEALEQVPARPTVEAGAGAGAAAAFSKLWGQDVTFGSGKFLPEEKVDQRSLRRFASLGSPEKLKEPVVPTSAALTALTELHLATVQ